jgi:multimeric flavodoxin WrbA
MKVLAINGSPRGENSCTIQMLKPLLKGMEQAGAETEVVNLSKLKINHCLGCFACWTKTPGICVHNDDMAPILQKLVDADLIIYGTPLYVFTMTGLMKDFLDRKLPLAMPFMEQNPNQADSTRHPGRYIAANKKILLVSPCGFPELTHFEPLVSYYKYLAKVTGMKYIGEILRPMGELLRVEIAQEINSEYSEDLIQAGHQIVANEKIDEILHKKLHKLWMSPEKYRELANQNFSEKLQ